MHALKAQERLCLAERHFMLASGRWGREPNEVTRLAAVAASRAVRDAEYGVRRAAVGPITWLHWLALAWTVCVVLIVLGAAP